MMAVESPPSTDELLQPATWPLWSRLILLLGPVILIVGGFVNAAVAKTGQSLVLGIVSAAVGALLVAQVPGR